jgi:hypothetical protein
MKGTSLEKEDGNRLKILQFILQAPYLEDPNTGAAMFESADIIDYLEKEYALVT